MNSIRQTQLLNKRELESAVPTSASWHADYRDTAYIYVGGFPFDLSEGDLITIFSQYGNPTHLNLIRDRETGKSKGFAFLKYEDQRSCDLAVDNLGGAEVLGRMLRVDHTRYKKKDGEDEDTFRIDRLERQGSEDANPGEDDVNGNHKRASDTEETDDGGRRKRRKRAMLPEEVELAQLLEVKEGEEEDPMRQYLIEQKKAEVEKAVTRVDKKSRHRHKHHHGKDIDRGEGREHTRHHHRHRDDQKVRPGRRKGHESRDGSRLRPSRRYSDSEDERPGRRHTASDSDDQDRRHRSKKTHNSSDGHGSPPYQRRRQDLDEGGSRSRSRSRRRRHSDKPQSRRHRQREHDRR